MKIIVIFENETPMFPSGIADLRRRNLGEKLVADSIPHQGPLLRTSQLAVEFLILIRWILEAAENWWAIGTVRSYLYPVHRTPTDDPIYREGMGLGEGR